VKIFLTVLLGVIVTGALVVILHRMHDEDRSPAATAGPSDPAAGTVNFNPRP
jgi:hypothetical protein